MLRIKLIKFLKFCFYLATLAKLLRETVDLFSVHILTFFYFNIASQCFLKADFRTDPKSKKFLFGWTVSMLCNDFRPPLLKKMSFLTLEGAAFKIYLKQ